MTKQFLTEKGVEQAGNYLAMTYAALGFTVSGLNLAGGLFFACILAAICARHRKDPVKIFWMYATTITFALLVAMAWPHLPTQLPVQLGMALSGGVSWVVPRVMNKGLDRVEERVPDVIDILFERLRRLLALPPKS